jgi:D-tyrosyl-tRNA(Tyr) deacylase
MRALIQRVTQASVSVDGTVIGQCGAGAMILVCAMPDDTNATADALALALALAQKIAKLRIFQDDAGKMNVSLLQSGGSALVVS